MEPKMTQEELIKEKPILSVLEEIEHLILCQKYIDQYDENVSLKNEVEVLRQQLAFYKRWFTAKRPKKRKL